MDEQQIPEIPVAQPVAPSPQPAGTAQNASTRATLALVLGVLSILCLGFFTGIPAFIIGSMELKDIRAGRAPAAGEGLAKVGYVLGIVGSILSCLAMLVFIGLLVLGITFGAQQAVQNTSFIL